MDAVRGGAAVGVVLGHSYTGSVAGVGGDLVLTLGNAVQVFFALSGFLLFRPYAVAFARGAPPPGAGEFWRRRALRILPGYWFALTLLAVLLGAHYVKGVFTHRWWVYYGLGQVYSLSTSTRVGGLAVAWSVCVEATFYLLLPLFALALARGARHVGTARATWIGLAILFALGFGVRLAVSMPLPLGDTLFLQRIDYALPGQLDFFVAGMALAQITVVAGERRLRGPLRAVLERPLLALALALPLWLIVGTVGGYAKPVSVPLVGTLSLGARFVLNDVLVSGAVFLLLAAAFGRREATGRLGRLWLRPLAFAGVVSYGTYLYHAALGTWVFHRTILWHVKHWGVAGWPVTFVVILSLGLAAGTLSYLLVELPFLRRKVREHAPARGTAAVARPRWPLALRSSDADR